MMDESQIQAQLKRENINLASLNKRAIAFMIDDMLVSAIFTLIFWDKFKTMSDPESLIHFINALFIYVIVVKTLYQTIFVALYGQTVGKMLTKIRVINREYLDQPDWLESFYRAGGRALSEVVFYLGFIWANYTPLRETWHDKFAKTLVVDV